MLLNQEKIEIDLKSIPALANAEPSDVSNVSLSNDKQSFVWKDLGVMLNVNNAKAHFEEVIVDKQTKSLTEEVIVDKETQNLTIEEYYFNTGLLIVELNNKETIMISLDQLQSKAINSGANDFFTSDTYIYENIQLSKDKRSFYWPNLNIFVGIGDIKHLSVNDRYSAIDEKKRLSNI